MKRVIVGWVIAAHIVLAAFGLLLFNTKVHAVFHSVAADRGHRGFDVKDVPHRKAITKILSLGQIGVMGRFKADVTDQLLMDDAETVLNIMDRLREPSLPGHFISIPVDPKKIDEAVSLAVAELKRLGDNVKQWNVPVETKKGRFKFGLIHSSKLDFLIVMRPPTSTLGEPPWIPVD